MKLELRAIQAGVPTKLVGKFLTVFVGKLSHSLCWKGIVLIILSTVQLTILKTENTHTERQTDTRVDYRRQKTSWQFGNTYIE